MSEVIFNYSVQTNVIEKKEKENAFFRNKKLPPRICINIAWKINIIEK